MVRKTILLFLAFCLLLGSFICIFPVYYYCTEAQQYYKDGTPVYATISSWEISKKHVDLPGGTSRPSENSNHSQDVFSVEIEFHLNQTKFTELLFDLTYESYNNLKEKDSIKVYLPAWEPCYTNGDAGFYCPIKTAEEVELWRTSFSISNPRLWVGFLMFVLSVASVFSAFKKGKPN